MPCLRGYFVGLRLGSDVPKHIAPLCRWPLGRKVFEKYQFLFELSIGCQERLMIAIIQESPGTFSFSLNDIKVIEIIQSER